MNLPESLYAVFHQKKDGQIMGSAGGYGYKCCRALNYNYKDENVIKGDITIYKNMTDTGFDCESEFLIPLMDKVDNEV
jgi:hypothetical protein